VADARVSPAAAAHGMTGEFAEGGYQIL
jgi:hypothetical protein